PPGVSVADQNKPLLLRGFPKGDARRHKLRIPHPAASGRVRSLRCASFFLGKRCAGLPRSGPFGADLVSHRTFNNAGGIPKGALPPLCRRGGGVHRGGTPSKGSRPYAPFWVLFRRGKRTPGYGAGGPAKVASRR